MPRTRSCKDMSLSEVQSNIEFPVRKSRRSAVNKKTDASAAEQKQKSNTTKKQTQKRVNQENISSDSLIKSPKQHVLSPIKSPLLDRTNYQSPVKSTSIVKRKLLLSEQQDNVSPCKSPRKDACSPHKSPFKIFSTENQTTPMKLNVKRKLLHGERKGTSYNKIRQALHTSIPEHILSREQQLNVIRKFIDQTVIQLRGSSMYMSGAPGTGKTACLTKVLEEMNCKNKNKLQSLFFNCMSLKLSQSIFTKLANELSTDGKTYTSKDSLKYLEKKFTSTGPQILLVLDEIDQLESKNQDVLYKLFEMPFLPNSRLVLIGIANALDLTDRILPRLQAKSSCKPMLLQFSPYTKDEICSILEERIKEIDSDIVDQSAILFCARKVSAMTGDIRKALDIMRRAVEIVESDCRKNGKNQPDGKIKKVTVTHISAVCSEVYGSRLSTSNGNQMTFPLQQKIVVCTLMACLKDKKVKEVTTAKLYESYCRVCKVRQVNHVSQEEFNGICSLLETQGIMSIKKGKDIRTGKISLRLQENELEHCLQDKTLMSSILTNGIPAS